MPSPFDFMHEMRDANEELNTKLDKILQRLDMLADRKSVTPEDLELLWYSDGK